MTIECYSDSWYSQFTPDQIYQDLCTIKLNNQILEGCLILLRERLTGKPDLTPESMQLKRISEKFNFTPLPQIL